MTDLRKQRRSVRPAVLFTMMMVLMAASCKKSGGDKAAEKVDFRFSNNVPEPIHIDIYNTHGNYYDNRSPVASADLSVNGEHTFTGLTSGQEYFIDWYSPDYNYNNWYNGQGIPSLYTGFTPTATNNHAQLNHLTQIDYSRTILIGGNGTASSWHAISAYKGAVYFWDSLDASGQSKRITFNKNFSGVYNYLSSGKLNSEPMDFVPDSRNSPVPEMTCVMASSIGHGNLGTVSSITTGNYAAKDSIRVVLTGSPQLYFIFRRD